MIERGRKTNIHFFVGREISQFLFLVFCTAAAAQINSFLPLPLLYLSREKSFFYSVLDRWKRGNRRKKLLQFFLFLHLLLFSIAHLWQTLEKEWEKKNIFSLSKHHRIIRLLLFLPLHFSASSTGTSRYLLGCGLLSVQRKTTVPLWSLSLTPSPDASSCFQRTVFLLSTHETVGAKWRGNVLKMKNPN